MRQVSELVAILVLGLLKLPQILKDIWIAILKFLYKSIPIFLFVIPRLYGSEQDLDYSQPFPENDEIQQVDFDVATDFGFTADQLKAARKRVKKTFNSKKHQDEVKASLGNIMSRAAYTDKAIGNMIKRADTVLRYKGFALEADKISVEYQTHYRTAVVDYVVGKKELGDHPPLSKWLTTVHEKIEDLIGTYLCKYFHLHDIYIFNYTVPVVFHPELYKQREYLKHFAGRHQAFFMWDYHGLAGVVTYWIVNIACSAGTSGMGAVAFVCGPISDLSEHYMDLDIAPPIATKIWERNNHETDFCSDISLKCN